MQSGDGTAEQFGTPNKAPVEVDHHSSFIALNEEESNVPEIQRLQGLFESIDLELEDAQITRVKDGDDSDQDSDDGLKQEVKELPNSSILDLHTITTSAKGGRFLVTPSSFRKPRGNEDDYDIHHLSQAEGQPSTPLADKSNRKNYDWENTTDLDAEKDPLNRKTSQTPARVTFAPTDPDADLDDLLNTLSTPVPSNNNTTSNNKTPMSAGQHGFTPMTLQELMKLETPESKVDEMLEELYQLMGYYNRTSEFLETQTTPFGTTDSANFSDTVTESSESAGEKVDLFGVSPNSSSDITHPPTDTAVDDVAILKSSAAATTDSTTDNTTIGENNTDTNNTDQDPLYRQRLRSASVDFDHDIKDIMQMSINAANPSNTNTNTNSNTSASLSPLDKSTFRSGWVNVTPKTTYTSGVLTPNTHTNATPSSHAKLHESIVHGDFYIWSHGSKLTAESINSSYVGLNPTSVTHNNDNGVLVPATLPSPSVPGSQLPREVNMHANSNTVGISGIRGSNILPNQGTSISSSHNTGYGVVPRTDNKHGYYVVYLLECVVRPDIELRDLLACVLKVARTRDCKAIFPHNNHIVLKSQSNTGYPQLPSTHPHSTAHPSTTAPNPNSIEWDQIDVQVVLSHSVKQRMLVCQFLRRVPSLTSSGFGNLNLIIYQIAGGAAPLSLENSPKTKSFVSKLKRELTEANLCLSSLYNAPLNTVCKLPQPGGLDAHFRAQLHQQVYGHMWSRLENDVKGMSEHLQAQLKECNEFRHTLEPIYKIYNMPSPQPWSSASHRNQTPIAINNNTHSVNTTPTTIRSEAYTTSASGVKSSVNVLYSPTAGHKSHNTQTALLMQNSNATKSIQTPGAATSGVHITPSTADRILDTYLNTSTPSHANTTPFKSTDGVTTPYANTDNTTSTSANNNSTLTSVSTTSNLSPMPQSPRYLQSASDSTSAPNSPLPIRYDAVEDGMTTVLLTLNECLQELQESSDEEYARRVQMQNEWVVRQVDNMQDYKQSLLFSLAANLEAEDSSLMKTFHATFYDVPTIIDVFGNTAFKSHNNSRTNSGSNSRTNSTERPPTTTANTAITSNNTSTSTSVPSSNITPTSVKPNDLYSEVLVEASLFNEFLDTPPPKSLTNKSTNNASVSGTANNNTIVPATTATTTPSKGWMSSLISSFYNNPVTQENALVGFKPKELRPVQTQADVNRRLSQYHTQHTQHSNTTKSTDASNASASSKNSEARGSGLATDDYQQVESLISLTPIVLYYCSCLVSKMPGTVYITPTTICLTYNAGLLTLNKIKEIYPITALHTVYLPHEWQNTSSATNAQASGMLDSNALKLVFYKSALTPVKPKASNNVHTNSNVPTSRDVMIAPMMLDCVKLRNILVEVKNAFNT